MKHLISPATSRQELGFYSIGLRPVTARALLLFVHANAVPSLDLRVGRQGFSLLERPVAESRALLDRIHAAAPLRMFASDIDLGEIVSDDFHEYAKSSIIALHELLSDTPDCPIRLLGRHVPLSTELDRLREQTKSWPERTLLLELHDPAWFHPALAAPWTLCGNWSGLQLLADSDQIAQAISRHGHSPVATSLTLMRSHLGMVHLCDTGNGLDQGATDLIAKTLSSRVDRGAAIPVGFEFIGPDRSATHVAQAYAEARRQWKRSLATCTPV